MNGRVEIIVEYHVDDAADEGLDYRDGQAADDDDEWHGYSADGDLLSALCFQGLHGWCDNGPEADHDFCRCDCHFGVFTLR
jgi:hypothetical protein